MRDFKVAVAENGRLVLPAAVRRHLNLGRGGMLIIRDDGGRFVLESADDAVRRAQALVRRFAPDASGVVDEFLAERRTEAAHEERS
jgi:AbrB family looped-hinge helix DNA binding protein